MDVSVVVPTYNRREMVLQTIHSLVEQTYPADRFEVIIADDGSTDGTGEAIAALNTPFRLRYLWQPNKGRCAARNMGIQSAEGNILLFLDGDMVAESHLVEEHVSSHDRYHDVLVRGDIRLLPQLKETKVFARIGLAELEERGRQQDEEGFLPFTLTLTGNLSVKAQHLVALGLMDENFDRGYAWDDIDWGYRAHKLGLRVLFNPLAVSYHNDYAAIDLQAHCRRMYMAARTAVTSLFCKYPELEGSISMFADKAPIDWRRDRPGIILRKVCRQMASCKPSMILLQWATHLLETYWPSPFLLRPFYRWVVGGYIYWGYRDGLAEYLEERSSIQCRVLRTWK